MACWDSINKRSAIINKSSTSSFDVSYLMRGPGKPFTEQAAYCYSVGMGGLSLSVLGSLVALLGDQPLGRFRTKSVQALLVYLTCQPEVPHRREHLMTLLWPGLPQQSAQANLRQTLYLLRQTIPEVDGKIEGQVTPLFWADRQTVRVNPEAAYDLDVLRCEELLKKGGGGRIEAVELYRGDLLADFYLPDSAAFEEWTLARREELRRQILRALEELAGEAIAAGDFESAVNYARRQIEIDPLRERAYRQLMEALARDGRRPEALAQYEALAELLLVELGVDPSPETQLLAEKIRDNSLEAIVERTAPAEFDEEPELIRHNLPPQTTSFIGRKKELAELDRLLAAPDARLITLVGPGGIGKTRLALEIACEQIDVFEHGVWFAALAKLSAAEELVPAVAQALDFSFYEGPDPKQQLLDYLRNKSLFLVLDNFEHLLAGGGLVSDIVKYAPGVKILVTSREPLRLVEEHLFLLDGLAFTRERVAEEDPAVQLFFVRARLVQPGLLLDAAGIDHMTTICHQVDGMPLGLELAAAWADTLSLSDIAVELRRDLDLLETDMRNIPSRHRSMRAVLDVSWQRLHTDEQRLFMQMSVFRGGFTRLAAREIYAPDMSQPTFLRLLASLTRRSFLQYDPDGERFFVHELMRQYGAEKLAEDQELEMAVRDRHATHFCEYLGQLYADLKSPRQIEAAEEIDAELENGRVAWSWAIRRQMWNQIQRIVLLWDLYLAHWRSRHEEADRLYETLVESLAGNGSLIGRQLLVQALLCWSWSKRSLGQLSEADQLNQKAQEIFSLPPVSEAEIWPGRSFVLRSLLQADFEERMEWCQQGVAFARRVGDQWELSRCLIELGSLTVIQGRFDEADSLLREALAIGRSSGDQYLCALILESRSLNAHTQYRFEEAEQYARESLALYSELGNQSGVAWSVDNLGHIYLYSGRYPQAIKAYRDRLHLFEELGSPVDIAWSHYWLSHTYLHAGEYAKSKVAAEKCLSIVKDDQFGRGVTLTHLGNNALIEGDYKTAESYFAESDALLRSIVLSVHQIWFQGYHVVALVHCGKVDEARQSVCDVLDVKTLAPTGVILFAGIALIYLAEERWERAVELYAMACTNPYAGKSSWVADLVGKKIDEVASRLPRGTVQAARRRGEETDMWEAAASVLEELCATRGSVNM